MAPFVDIVDHTPTVRLSREFQLNAVDPLKADAHVSNCAAQKLLRDRRERCRSPSLKQNQLLSSPILPFPEARMVAGRPATKPRKLAAIAGSTSPRRTSQQSGGQQRTFCCQWKALSARGSPKLARQSSN